MNFMVDDAMNLDEIVATGELYKQGSGRKNWCLRKFILSGIYLIYFNRKGEKRGQWDITECVVKKLTPEECSMPAAKHAFALIGPKKYYLACASSEKNRHAWLTVIEEQIEEFKEDIRRFLRSGEVVHGNAIVKKKNMLGMTSNVRLLLTNFPRIMVIDPASLVMKEQMSWGRDLPPTFTRITDTKFKITQLHGKDFTFEDMENGTKYWEDIFRRFPNMKYYVHKQQKSLNIDFHDFVDPEDDAGFAAMLEEPAARTPQQIAQEDRNKANLKFLDTALQNIKDLVDALTLKIDALDDEDEEADRLGIDNEETRAARADRANKRAQLQILKDNVTVLSNNLQSLVSKSNADGTTDFDVEAIEAVIEETAAMLALLNASDEEVFSGYDNNGVGNVGDVDGDGGNYGNEIVVDGVEWTVVDDAMADEQFARLDAIDDILITSDNFDPNDPNRRPANWKEVRLKRVMMKEYVDRLEGVPEDVIKERRAKRLEMEERLMTQEVVERGRLLNMPVLRKVRTPSQRRMEEAAMAITDDNFDADKRPLAWQAVKLKRVMAKEDLFRRQGMEESDINANRPRMMIEEEKIMLEEVAKYGKVMNLGTPGQDKHFKASQLVINNKTYDPKNPNKRPEGWFEVRKQRVLVKEQIDRMQGVSDERIYAMRAQREKDEEALMMKEVSEHGRVLSVRFDKTNDDDPNNMKFTKDNFNPSDPTKRPKGWFELRKKRVLIKEDLDRQAGIPEETISEGRGQRELEEEALMLTEVAASGRVNGADFDRSQDEVLITRNNFVANDGSKRPQGWAELRMKRVMLKEAIDRLAGIDEEMIMDMRSDREIKEEADMVDEVLCLGRVLGVGESSSAYIPKVHEVKITNATYDASNPNKRPNGWFEARAKRVMIKEQVDRNNGVSEEDIEANHDKKDEEEERLMMEEVATYGHLVGVGGPTNEDNLPLKVPVLEFTRDNFDPSNPARRPDGWAAARKKRVYKKEQLEKLRGVPNHVIEAGRRQREIDEEKQMLEEVAKYGHLIGIGGPYKNIVAKNVNDSLDIDDTNFDAATGMRPKGWAEVKLRRIYLKEWKDRRAGVPEDEIAARREQYAAEVEQEMCNEAGVFNRVRMIEKRIKQAAAKGGKAVVVPKGYAGHVVNKKGAGLDKFLSAANQTLESLSEKVSDTLAEKVMGEEPGSRASRRFGHQKPVVNNGPRVIAPAKPRGPAPPRSPRQITMKADLQELEINDTNFDASDPRKRPVGWELVRQRRIEAVEANDRATGVAESMILSRREQREFKEEENMIDEVLSKRAVSKVGGAPVFPTAFQSSLAKQNSLGGSKGLSAQILARK